jgi:hypothetical protein
MSIIVEDGTGVTGAESYVSTAFCDTYHANRNNTGWAAIASTALKEGYLRQAEAYLRQTYRGKWKGVRVTALQALDWPRWGCEITDVTLGQISYYVPYNVIPLELQYVQAELALFAVAGALNPNLKQGIITKKVGPIEIEYDPYSSQSPRYPIVDGYMKIFIQAGMQGGAFRLVRT